MTAKLTLKKITLLLLAILLAFSVFSVSVFAQESTGESATGNVGIQLSAPVYTFTINPGESAQEIIKVRNLSDTTKTFYPEILDFKPTGETGTPEYITNNQSEDYSSYSLSSWINISTEGIKLEPNKSAALNFTINVPENAEPGGKYAGILMGTSPPEAEANQVAIAAKVASMVIVRVAGDARELAQIAEFTVGKSFYQKPPVDFVARIENKGNVHVVPKGNIEIKDIFGRTVDAIPVNQTQGNILPESIRKFDKESDGLSWNPGGFTIGKYTANIVLTYGDPSQNLTASVSFWVVPWIQLAIILAVIIVLLALIFFGIKRYNKYIISKAQQPSNDSGKTDEK